MRCVWQRLNLHLSAVDDVRVQLSADQYPRQNSLLPFFMYYYGVWRVLVFIGCVRCWRLKSQHTKHTHTGRHKWHDFCSPQTEYNIYQQIASMAQWQRTHQCENISHANYSSTVAPLPVTVTSQSVFRSYIVDSVLGSGAATAPSNSTNRYREWTSKILNTRNFMLATFKAFPLCTRWMIKMMLRHYFRLDAPIVCSRIRKCRAIDIVSATIFFFHFNWNIETFNFSYCEYCETVTFNLPQ